MYALTILPFLAIHRMYAGIKDMDGDGQVDAQDILIWLQRLYSLVFDESLKRVQAWWQRQGGWVMDLYEAAGKKFENGITAPGKTKHVQKSLHNWASVISFGHLGLFYGSRGPNLGRSARCKQCAQLPVSNRFLGRSRQHRSTKLSTG